MDIYLGCGLYADIDDDWNIEIRKNNFDGRIELDHGQQAALENLIQRRRRQEAEFELAAGRQEIAD